MHSAHLNPSSHQPKKIFTLINPSAAGPQIKQIIEVLNTSIEIQHPKHFIETGNDVTTERLKVIRNEDAINKSQLNQKCSSLHAMLTQHPFEDISSSKSLKQALQSFLNTSNPKDSITVETTFRLTNNFFDRLTRNIHEVKENRRNTQTLQQIAQQARIFLDGVNKGLIAHTQDQTTKRNSLEYKMRQALASVNDFILALGHGSGSASVPSYGGIDSPAPQKPPRTFEYNAVNLDNHTGRKKSHFIGKICKVVGSSLMASGIATTAAGILMPVMPVGLIGLAITGVGAACLIGSHFSRQSIEKRSEETSFPKRKNSSQFIPLNNASKNSKGKTPNLIFRLINKLGRAEDKVGKQAATIQDLTNQLNEKQKTAEAAQTQLTTLQQKLERLQNDQVTSQEKQTNLEGNIKGLEDQIEGLEEQVQEAQRNLEEAQKTNNANKTEIKDLRNKAQEKETVAKALKETQRQLQEQLATLEKEKTAAEKDNQATIKGLNDQIKGLEDQIEGLEEQVQEAQRNLEKAQKTNGEKEADIERLTNQVAQQEQAAKALKETQRQLQEQLATLEKEKTAAEKDNQATIKGLNDQIKGLEDQIEGLEEQVQEAQRNLEEAQKTNNANKTEIKDLRNKAQEKETVAEAAQTQLATLQKELQQLQNDQVTSQEKQTNLEGNIKGLEDQIEGLEEQVQEAQRNLEKAQKTNGEKEADIERLTNQVAQQEQAAKALKETQRQLQEQLATLEKEKTAAEKDNQATIKGLNDQIKGLEDQIEGLEEQVQEAQRNLEKAQKTNGEKEADIERLTNQVAQQEQAAKALKETQRQLQEQLATLEKEKTAAEKDNQATIKGLNDQIKGLEDQIEGLEEQVQEAQRNLEEAQKTNNANKTEIKDLRNKAQEKETVAEAAQTQLATLQKELQQLQNDQVTSEEERTALKEKIKANNQAALEAKKNLGNYLIIDIEKKENQLNQYTRAIEDLKEDLNKIYKENETLIKDNSQAICEFDINKEIIHALDSEIQSLLNKLREAKKEIDQDNFQTTSLLNLLQEADEEIDDYHQSIINSLKDIENIEPKQRVKAHQIFKENLDNAKDLKNAFDNTSKISLNHQLSLTLAKSPPKSPLNQIWPKSPPNHPKEKQKIESTSTDQNEIPYDIEREQLFENILKKAEEAFKKCSNAQEVKRECQKELLSEDISTQDLASIYQIKLNSKIDELYEKRAKKDKDMEILKTKFFHFVKKTTGKEIIQKGREGNDIKIFGDEKTITKPLAELIQIHHASFGKIISPQGNVGDITNHMIKYIKQHYKDLYEHINSLDVPLKNSIPHMK